MHSVLQFAKTAYIEEQNLMPMLADYVKPRALISRLVKKGELIRIKNGFFVISEKIKNARVSYEQIANLLCGPSYISFEWALSHYGMIPEGVYVVTSATVTRSTSYTTPLGTFDFIHLGHSRYVVGIDQGTNEAGNFLIATPEKALADLVHAKSKHLDSRELLVDLIEGRRIDEDQLKQLNKQHLLEIADNYRSQTVTNLVNALGLL